MYGFMCLIKIEGYVVILVENMEVVIYLLELIIEDWKYMFVGVGGRGGVFLIFLDIDILVVIYLMIVILLMMLKMVFLKRLDNYFSYIFFL